MEVPAVFATTEILDEGIKFATVTKLMLSQLSYVGPFGLNDGARTRDPQRPKYP